MAIRKIISVQDGPIHLISEYKLFEVLMEGLEQSEYQRLQVECGWALANIASGNGKFVEELSDNGRGV